MFLIDGMMHGPTQGHKAMFTEMLILMYRSFFLLHFYWLRNVLLRVISPFVEFLSFDRLFRKKRLTYLWLAVHVLVRVIPSVHWFDSFYGVRPVRFSSFMRVYLPSKTWVGLLSCVTVIGGVSVSFILNLFSGIYFSILGTVWVPFCRNLFDIFSTRIYFSISPCVSVRVSVPVILPSFRRR